MKTKTKLTVLPGDGIGPEVITQAMRVLRTVADLCGHELETRECPVGGVAIKQSQSPFPRATMDACLESDAVLLGAVGGPEYDTLPRNMRPETGLLQLRTALGGYANLRPAISYPCLSAGSPLRAEVTQGANILIIRELLGGLYFGEPRQKTDDVAFNTMRYTVSEIQRVARIGFEQARKRKRKLTSIDKANVLEVSQLRHASGDEPAALRRDRHRKPVRRHSLRRSCSDYRLARHAGFCHYRRAGRTL